MTGFHTYIAQNGVPIAIDLSTLPEVFDELARIDAELATMRTQVTHLIIAYETRIRDLEKRLQGENGNASDIENGNFRFPECVDQLRQSTFENLGKLAIKSFCVPQQSRSDEEQISECDKKNNEEMRKHLQ
ncbi:unnamed protein product, partial [Mesorhabditis belari]|uniref:Uncharacterized protein n=1 Tax=Mesorhabditis belari TaxID=2138241 RepID=A0AAF3E7Z1_9BILA